MDGMCSTSGSCAHLSAHPKVHGPFPLLVVTLVVFITGSAWADDGGGLLDPQAAVGPFEEPVACRFSEIRQVENALRSKKDRTKQCASLKAKHGDDFSYAEFMHGRYRTKFVAGVFLTAAGAGLALAAVGTGIAWSQTPQEDAPDTGPFFSLHLSERDKYRVATLVLAPVSLVLLVSGALTMAIVRPRMLRLEELVSDTGHGSIRFPIMALETFVDAHGAAGGRLRISF